MANQTQQLAALLRQEGVHVEVVQVNAPYSLNWIGKLKGIRAFFRLIPYLIKLWRTAGKNDLMHIMANSGWSWHLFAAPAIWIAKFRKTPVIVNYRGGEAESFLSRSLRWVKPSLENADEIIVPSKFLKGIFAKFGFQTTIVPNIIDLSRFSPKLASAIKNLEPLILVARNLEPIYDNSTVLHAFSLLKKQLPKAKLILTGSGPEKEILQELAQTLNIHIDVTFTGRIENAQMPELYRLADLVVNPSLADNMPISILEAWASGVPVVSTNVGGVPFMVEDRKNAILIPVRDPQAMATAMLQVLISADMALHLSKAGLEAVQQFTWSNVQHHLFTVYARVCKLDPLKPDC